MAEDDERGDGGVGLGRTLALSDGIFAISMTLLAFQIQPPVLKKADVSKLAGILATDSTRYYVYVLSFTVIGVLWLAHHRLFSHVGRADEILMTLNLLFLMVIAGLPFPSAIMGRYGSQRVAIVLYAAAMAIAGALLTTLTIVVQRRGLMTAGSTRQGLRLGMWRAATMTAVFALSIPVAFVSPSIAPVTWITTLLIRLIPAGRHRPKERASLT